MICAENLNSGSEEPINLTLSVGTLIVLQAKEISGGVGQLLSNISPGKASVVSIRIIYSI